MLESGRIIAQRYRLTELLGTGGMATVWAATHLELSTPVAVKFQKTWVKGDRAAEERFKREARAAARLKSPHIVHVYDYGVDAGIPYIVMELLHGESLRDRLNRLGRLPAEEVLRWVRQAAKALDFAHKSGVVHRDVKPSNLFLSRDGDEEVMKLLDFGIARASDPETGTDATDSAVIMGSVAYMSREQARGERIDSRSDVWSLAVVAYEALLGETPFQGGNVPDTLARINGGAFRRPSEFAREYGALDALFQRAFHAVPRERSASAGEFALELARTLDVSVETPPVAAVPRGRVDDTATLDTHEKTNRVPRPSRGFTALLVVFAGGAGTVALWNALRDPPKVEGSKSSAEPAMSTRAPASVAAPPGAPAPSPAPAPLPAPSAATEPPRVERKKPRTPAGRVPPPPGASAKRSSSSDPMFGIDITR